MFPFQMNSIGFAETIRSVIMNVYTSETNPVTSYYKGITIMIQLMSTRRCVIAVYLRY